MFDEDELCKLFDLEKEQCPTCGAHLKLVGEPSYRGGVGKPICLNSWKKELCDFYANEISEELEKDSAVQETEL